MLGSTRPKEKNGEEVPCRADGGRESLVALVQAGGERALSEVWMVTRRIDRIKGAMMA